MKLNIQAAWLVAALCLSAQAAADSTQYNFSGLYNIAGGTQAYTGVLSIADPMPTTVRPPWAADVTQPYIAAVWSGTSRFYTGGSGLTITFASGTLITAPLIDIVVNNTAFSGQGAPYPMGLSVQLYPTAFSVVAPTTTICATPTGVCGPDDDPLYQDATQTALMATTGIYFAFYNAPQGFAIGVPNLVTSFPQGDGGLGLLSVQNGLNSTALTSFNAFSSVTTPSTAPVPEPATALLLVAGAAGLIAKRKLAGPLRAKK